MYYQLNERMAVARKVALKENKIIAGTKNAGVPTPRKTLGATGIQVYYARQDL